MRTLEEVSEISGRKRQLLVGIRGTVLEHLPRAEVLLYGSVARGSHDGESDYDILVLTEEALSRARQNEVRGAVFDWELERGVVVSVLFRSREEWDSPLGRASPFRREVERDALAL